MKTFNKLPFAIAISLTLGAAVGAYAHPGEMRGNEGAGTQSGPHAGMHMKHGSQGGHRPEGMQPVGHGPGAGGHGPMAGPTAMLTKQDAGSAADMGVVMDLLHNNTQIKRSVTRLPDGIRTVTESDDPKVAQAIKAHVASMSGRLKDGREFNIFSTTLPVIFDNADKIKSAVEMTDKGAVVTRTSSDSKVVAALQAHAGEVTELVQDGMRRGMMARMAMGAGGPRGAMGAARPADASQSERHAH
jgi:hypothetical protein